jgi:hypothetical protein
MSVLSDFIIATEAQAQEYGRSQSGVPASDVLELKGLTLVELSTLWALMRGEEWNDGMLDAFAPVPTGDGRDSSISRLPAEFLARLTGSDFDLDQVASRWAATEEMRCDAQSARTLISDLARFAGQAGNANQSVYLWNGV